MDKPKLFALTGKDASAPDQKIAAEFYRALEIDVLARTLWGEARGEGEEGMVAVACVILNRVQVAHHSQNFWWGNNIIQVCQKPYQFSCWNRSDPSFQKLQAVNAQNRDFAMAQRVACRAVKADLKDNTSGATHYHATYVTPYWAKGQKPLCQIGHHLFYRL